MPPGTLAATWLFADPETPAEEVQSRALAAVPGPGTLAFEQVTGGRGALLIGTNGLVEPAEAWRESRAGRFAIRSAYPPGADIILDRSPFLLAVRLSVPEIDREEVRRWLDQEHSRSQLGVAGTHWYLGYEEVGADHTFLNLWGLAAPQIIETEAWE